MDLTLQKHVETSRRYVPKLLRYNRSAFAHEISLRKSVLICVDTAQVGIWDKNASVLYYDVHIIVGNINQALDCSTLYL